MVSILAATKDSAILPYLERTIHHSDARVRRESIRALSAVSNRVAHEMLVHALTDDDGQNVQLAARYLGQAQVTTAIPSLEQVARGEGHGSRDTAPRVEAIETLGRLGSTRSLPTLEALAGRRTLIGAGKTRELAAAAEAAIARIRAGEGA
jgi:HEAT repeat protein